MAADREAADPPVVRPASRLPDRRTEVARSARRGRCGGPGARRQPAAVTRPVPDESCRARGRTTARPCRPPGRTVAAPPAGWPRRARGPEPPLRRAVEEPPDPGRDRQQAAGRGARTAGRRGLEGPTPAVQEPAAPPNGRAQAPAGPAAATRTRDSVPPRRAAEWSSSSTARADYRTQRPPRPRTRPPLRSPGPLTACPTLRGEHAHFAHPRGGRVQTRASGRVSDPLRSRRPVEDPDDASRWCAAERTTGRCPGRGRGGCRRGPRAGPDAGPRRRRHHRVGPHRGRGSSVGQLGPGSRPRSRAPHRCRSRAGPSSSIPGTTGKTAAIPRRSADRSTPAAPRRRATPRGRRRTRACPRRP